MNFKLNTFNEIKKEVVSSFLSISILVSPLMSLKAQEKEEFPVEFPKSKPKIINIDYIREEDLISKNYAHGGSYNLFSNKITYRHLVENKDLSIYFEEKSNVLRHDFLLFKYKEKNYALFFILFENSSVYYYLFDGNGKDVNIGEMKIDKFKVPKDVKMKIKLNLEEKEYIMRFESSEYESPLIFYADIIFEKRFVK